jgi:spoIIIJ-associated protein
MAAVTEDDNPGQPPVAGSMDTAAAPAGEPSGEAGDAGDAAQAGGRDEAGQPGGRDEASGPVRAAEDVARDAGEDDEDAPAAGEDDEDALDRPGHEVADLEQEQEIAADYLEGLLDIVGDPDSEFDMGVEGDRALVSVVGASLHELIGPRGEVLEALQELTRLAVHRQTGMRTRIMLDVGGYRVRRRMELSALGRDAAEDVSRTGIARRLDPMTPFERKIVHDAVAAAGLRSESEGEEPNRRVVVLPAG